MVFYLEPARASIGPEHITERQSFLANVVRYMFEIGQLKIIDLNRPSDKEDSLDLCTATAPPPTSL